MRKWTEYILLVTHWPTYAIKRTFQPKHSTSCMACRRRWYSVCNECKTVQHAYCHAPINMTTSLRFYKNCTSYLYVCDPLIKHSFLYSAERVGAKLFAGTAKAALSWTHTPSILFIHLGQTLVTNSDLRGPAVCSGRSKLLEPTSQRG